MIYCSKIEFLNIQRNVAVLEFQNYFVNPTAYYLVQNEFDINLTKLPPRMCSGWVIHCSSVDFEYEIFFNREYFM